MYLQYKLFDTPHLKVFVEDINIIFVGKLIYVRNMSFQLSDTKLLRLVPFSAHLPVQRWVNSDFSLPILDFISSLVL